VFRFGGVFRCGGVGVREAGQRWGWRARGERNPEQLLRRVAEGCSGVPSVQEKCTFNVGSSHVQTNT